ncbi:ATP-binding protein [Mycobacterium sp. NPDC006124]|uniref:ATP-binding protein n=1 Tax=Mycobacterium sp. NPDC006124 TaxID=3156729 RepID=UPI0033A81390
MIDSITKTVTSAERLERVGVPAEANAAAKTRDDFSRWLQGTFDLEPHKANDLVLAIYEALANVAEFAYSSTGYRGTMDLSATHDPNEAALTVTVADRGRWRTAPSHPADRTRGRGIALMKALSDRASIQTSTTGTTVRLVWTGIHRR